MLIFNPTTVDRRAKGCDPFLAERRRGVSPDQIAQRLELQHPGAGVGERRLHQIHVTRSGRIGYARAEAGFTVIPCCYPSKANPSTWAGGGYAFAAAAEATVEAGWLATGKRTTKTAPPSGRLWQVIWPWCSWTTPQVTLKPRPIPLPTGLVV